jgi:hypothetical protein
MRDMKETRAGRSPGGLLRGAETVLSASLFGSWLLPWVSLLGSPLMAYEIRERLRGPHRLVSAFTRDSQISFDYAFSRWLWLVPASAALAFALSLSGRGGRARGWACLLAGAAGMGAFAFLKVRLSAYPFQHLEDGAFLAVFAGTGLGVAGVLRLRS